MINQILPFLIAAPFPVIWIIFVIPLLFRLVGVSLPLNPRKRAALNHQPGRNIFADGLLYWAMPMFIFSVANIYARWRLYGALSDQLTTERITDELGISLLGGILFGLVSAHQEEKRSQPK